MRLNGRPIPAVPLRSTALLALAAALPQMTPEAECNRIISGYCREYGFDYSACWNTSS